MILIVVLLSLFLVSGCSTTLGPKERLAEREEIKREVIAELRAEAGSPQVIPAGIPTGTVEGRILRRGQPLADCRIRLVRLEERAGLFGLGGDYIPAGVVETATNRDGLFHLELVPVGKYKIKWAVPGGDSWIRILAPEPDLTVQAGKTTTFRDIETGRRLLDG